MLIDNDVKYGEELQVRITQQMASRLCSEEVTVADAEYVYEGGVEEIPGRPKVIAQVLLAANDVYDDVADFSEDHDAAHITAIGAGLGLAWNGDQVAALTAIVDAANADGVAMVSEADSQEGEITGDQIVRRLALSAAAYAGVLSLGENFAAAALLFVNELNEIQELPRIFAEIGVADQLRSSAQAYAESGGSDAAGTFADAYAELVKQECAKHREDVLWNPAEAKKRAKEADEAKNKAALAAKFAHVDNDAGKEHVEL
jgi:hypothetical protein